MTSSRHFRFQEKLRFAADDHYLYQTVASSDSCNSVPYTVGTCIYRVFLKSMMTLMAGLGYFYGVAGGEG